MTCLSGTSNYRKTLHQTLSYAVAVIAMAGACWPVDALAQGGFSSTPQTNLGPIRPPASVGGSAPNRSGASPSPTPPSYDPYATGAGSGGSSAAFTPPGFGSGSGYGSTTVSPLGTPTPIGPPSFSAGPPAASGGNPSYPNGSFLGGLFSGNWFRGGTGSSPYQGAGYPSSGTLPYGSGPATAAPYNAPSIYNSPPGGSGPLYGNDSMMAPSPAPGAGGGYGGGGFSGAPFPPSAYPSGSPTSLFPSGLGGGGYGGSLLPSGLFSAGGMSAYQLLHGPRLRHTFISGGDHQDDLGINQTDVSLSFACDNFLYSSRPLYITPSFSLYLFDGPITAPPRLADLPGSAYGGYLDFGWQTDPNQIIGGELGVRVGAFTAFDTFNSDSIRVMGKGLVSFRLTPASTLKAGVYYLDRESIKMLPAGGLLWQPNPFTRFDIFFPEPKFARYWRTIGTQDVWWYLAGEYGGDSWTITRNSIPNFEERVDVNQIGVTFGWEWGRSDLIRMGERTAFLEFGGVFARELKYEFSNHDQDLGEAFLVRAGFGY